MEKFSIYLRRDGRWEGRIQLGKDESGKRKYRSFFGRKKEDVHEKMAEFRRSGVDSIQEFCTVSEVFDEWFQKALYSVKESTASNYRMKANKHILPYFGHKIINKIEDADIYKFIEEKKKSGLSGRYISDIIILLKSLFKFAVRKLHFNNPMEEVSLKREKLPEIGILNAEEQTRLEKYLWEFQDRTSMGIALSFATGIRIGELCALRWKDIDLEKRILTVKHTIQRITAPHGFRKTKIIITEPKSDSSKRIIPIPEFLIDFLKKFKGQPNEFILSGKEKPVEPRTMQYRFSKILKNVDLPSVHFHALRHMFASNCIALGFNVKLLSEILGHSSVEITLNRYVHSSFEQKIECMNRLKFSI